LCFPEVNEIKVCYDKLCNYHIDQLFNEINKLSIHPALEKFKLDLNTTYKRQIMSIYTFVLVPDKLYAFDDIVTNEIDSIKFNIINDCIGGQVFTGYIKTSHEQLIELFLTKIQKV
jgi:phage terminase Nu1 subunit (DNA packaging protein)